MGSHMVGHGFRLSSFEMSIKPMSYRKSLGFRAIEDSHGKELEKSPGHDYFI